MNRCTQLDEILHERVPRQPLEVYWISSSNVKVTWSCAFFSMRDTATTRGQYLVLSKAWRSCFWFKNLFQMLCVLLLLRVANNLSYCSLFCVTFQPFSLFPTHCIAYLGFFFKFYVQRLFCYFCTELYYFSYCLFCAVVVSIYGFDCCRCLFAGC